MRKARKLKNKWVSILVLAAVITIVSAKSFLFAQGLHPQSQKVQAEEEVEASALDKKAPNKSEGEGLELSLEDVTKLALANSLDIQIAQFDAYISRVSLKKEESVFDTFLNTAISFKRDKQMQPSTVFGTETKQHEFSVGVEKKTPTGTTISLDATGTKNRSNSIFSTLNPYNEALLGLSITQELGKNFFGLADRSKIKITKIDIENSEFSSLDDIERVLCDAQRSYWNLVLREEELAIKKDMLKEAEKLYKIYQDKYSLGLVEESELLAVEALVHTRGSSLAIARLERNTAKNNLLFLINKGDFEQEIIPKERLEGYTSEVNLHQALAKAIQYRRDYKRTNNEIEKNNIDIVVKKNALWPQIDLEASLNRNSLNSNRGRAWEGIGKNSNDEVFVGLSFKISLENNEAKAELKGARFQKKRILLKLKRIERLILRELNDKVNQVNVM